MSFEEYILRVLEGTVPSRPKHVLSPQERAAVWRQTAKRFPETPLLSDEAVSREGMYPDDDRSGR
jgi:hypothetical protein